MILELRNVDKKTVSKSGVINYVEYLNLKYGGKKMYNTHALEISEHALKTPEGLTSVIRFTLCTIQQSLYSCENQIADIEKHGFKSRFLKNKQKAKGLKYAMDNQVKLFWAVQELKKQSLNDVDTVVKAVRLFNDIPGIGMVKASFICQMLGFNVACLDVHNLNRLGLDVKDVTLPKSLTDKTKLKKIKAYVHLTQKQGTVYWWNSWCDYVAKKGGANKLLPTGEDVSAFHVGCVVR